MNFPSTEFDNTIQDIISGNASTAQISSLAKLLQANLAAQDSYLLAVELHSRLASENALFNVSQASQISIVATSTPRNTTRSFSSWSLVVSMCVVLLTLSCGIVFYSTLKTNAEPVKYEVLESEAAFPNMWQPGQQITASQINLTSGQLSVRLLNSGVKLQLSGASQLQLVHPMLVRVTQGQVVADVGERGKGFSMETAQAKLVDLGTTFGVQVDPHHSTDVVVFNGSVQVFENHATTDSKPISTLLQGEAVRMTEHQPMARIPNIIRRANAVPWTTQASPDESCLIASVRDNLRTPETKIFYEIVPQGFAEGVAAYVGPKHLWKGRTAQGLPRYLLGADYVRTFMNDHRKQNLAITIKLSKPVVLYVLFECRPQQERWRELGYVELAPRWLQEQFQKTGDAVGLDDAGQLAPGEAISTQPGVGHLVTFDVWKREIHEPGEITLGPPTGSDGWLNWMYGIAAQPLEATNRANK